MQRRVLFLVNGGESGAMGIRARGLARALPERFSPILQYRAAGGKWAGFQQFQTSIANHPAELIYVMDMAAAGVSAALWRKVRGGPPIIIDTGDAITALARSAKLRGQAGIAATWLLEEAGLRGADHIVVRGSRHQEILAERGVAATWIPDGFEADLFFPSDSRPPREFLTLGLLGSVTWAGQLETTYGWDLIETLAQLSDVPCRGLLVGDGTGLERLKEYAQERKVADRIEFAGRVRYEELRGWIHRMDICLSTQTNDLPGQVRTTGKLPLYTACGRFVLASRVGEAARQLPEEMLVEYEGAVDPSYPAKLAARIRDLVARQTDWSARGAYLAQNVAPRFDYQHLGKRLGDLLDTL